MQVNIPCSKSRHEHKRPAFKLECRGRQRGASGSVCPELDPKSVDKHECDHGGHCGKHPEQGPKGEIERIEVNSGSNSYVE